MVGVNAFAEKGPRGPLFHIDPKVERRQIERVRAVRATRNVDRWQTALEAVSRAAREGGNLVPPIITAVRDDAPEQLAPASASDSRPFVDRAAEISVGEHQPRAHVQRSRATA